jgi:hypothetical protein
VLGPRTVRISRATVGAEIYFPVDGSSTPVTKRSAAGTPTPGRCGLHHPPAIAGAPNPTSNPLIYSLDLLVPLVNFGLRDAYEPQGPQRWLAYLLIAVCWIFITTIAAGIAQVLRRQ